MKRIIRDEPAADYHANTCLTSSRLRAFDKSPQLYLDVMAGIGRKETKSFAFGELFHMAVLEPDRYASTVVNAPDGINKRTKAGKEWRANAEAAGKVVISDDDECKIRRMIERCPKRLLKKLRDCESEVTFRDDELGIQCRVDAINMQSGYKGDLKTICDIDQIERHIANYRYDMQEAWYDFVVDVVADWQAESKEFIFAETAPPYRWRVVTLSKQYQRIAREQTDDAWLRYKICRDARNFEDREPIDMYVEPPEWLDEEEY